MMPGVSGGAKGSLAQAQADLSAMRARGLTDSHPDVIALKAQVAALQRASAGDAGPGGMPNPAYSSLQSIKADREASIVALQSRRASLSQELAQLTGRQFSEPGLAAEAARINRDYDVLKEQYDKLLRDREQLRLRGQVETERNAVKFEVIDPPTTPRKPSAPDRPMLLFIVLIVGIAAGCGSAFGIGQLRSTYSTTGQLERATGMQVVGSVTLTLSRRARAQYWRQLKWFAGGVASLAFVLVVLLAVEFMKRGMVA